MRELKFRIWIKDEKRYYDESDEESYMIVPNGNVTYTSEAYEENGAWFTDTTSATDDVVVEQYTGLKDKNGKEIYDGDILKFEDSIFEIGWLNKSARFGFCPIKECNIGMSFSLSRSKVIGNIHENSELVKAK